MLRCSAIVLTFVVFTPFAAAGGKAAPAVLRVASPELPANFRPTGPLTDADRQARDLVFESLIAAVHDDAGTTRYRPGLAEAIPSGQGTHLTFRVRPDAKWANGDPVTANDLRRSLEQLQQTPGAAFAWNALLEQPQLGNSSRDVRVSLRHGLIDPWDCFDFPIVPQQVADGDSNPLGSGPFALVGPLKEAGVVGIRFRKNPHHPVASALPFDEIHWFAPKTSKDLDALKADLVLGFGGDVRNAKSALTRRVWYVAPNHRHPLLASPELRGFLGASIDRDKIVGSQPKLSVNGLTPRETWAQAPKLRVSVDLHRPEVALAHAKELAKTNKSIALSFKFPADQTAAMTQLVDQWQAAAHAGGLDLKIQPMPLSPTELAQSIAKHEFELALAYEDHGDSIGRLTALFDPSSQARAPGGSNILGVRDGNFQEQIMALPRTRQFPSLREQMHNLHVHMVQSMPLIPLWQHQAHFSLNPSYRVAHFDPLRPFADLSAWRK